MDTEFSIYYTNGFVITKDKLDMLVDRRDMDFNMFRAKLEIFIYNGLRSYESIGDIFKFRTHNGTIIPLKRITYGTTVDVNSEILFISGTMSNPKKILSRVPAMCSIEFDFIGDTFIEIDKHSKMLYYRCKNTVLFTVPITCGFDCDGELKDGIYGVISKYNTKDTYLGNYSNKDNQFKMRLGITKEGAGIQNLGYVDNRGSISIDPILSEKLYNAVQVNTPVFIHSGGLQCF